MDTRKIPAISPVAKTDLVSRYTQNVTANQTVKFMTDTTSVLSSRCRNVRPGPVRSSSAGAGLRHRSSILLRRVLTWCKFKTP